MGTLIAKGVDAIASMYMLATRYRRVSFYAWMSSACYLSRLSASTAFVLHGCSYSAAAATTGRQTGAIVVGMGSAGAAARPARSCLAVSRGPGNDCGGVSFSTRLVG